MSTPSSGPLAGLRVLDLTRLYPGPLAGMLMADMGADVIKVEDAKRPDAMRGYPPMVDGISAGFMAVNRSKRMLSLDLDDPDQRARLHALIRDADILLEGFKPGVLAAQGLGYDDCKALNPKLIYVSITGYGQTGPYAQKVGHDLNYIGYAGLLGLTGTPESPIPPGGQIADVAGGAYGAVMGALAAVHARTHTGEGQHVDVAMLDCVMPLTTLQMAHAAVAPQTVQRGQAMLSGGVPCYGVYATADDGHVALAALEPKFWRIFCQAIERSDWLGRQFDQGLIDELAELFASRSRDTWCALGEDCCLSPVLSPHEVVRDPQVQAREMVSSNGIQLGPPLKFSATPAKPGRHMSGDVDITWREDP